MISTNHWLKLKQEFIPVLYIASFGCALSKAYLPYSPLMKFGTPWGELAMIILNIITIIAVCFLFAKAQSNAYHLNYEYIGDESTRSTFKYIQRISMIVAFNIVFLFFWYYRIFNIPQHMIMAWYLYLASAFMLYFRAVSRKIT